MSVQGQEVVKVFDWPSEEAAQQKIIGALDQVEAKIKSISGVSAFGKNVSGVTEFKQSTVEMTKAMEDLAAMQKKLTELENQLAAARRNNNKAGKDQTDEQLRTSIKLQQDMKARKDAIKAEEDAYKQLALAYNKAAAEAKTLQAVALKSGLEQDKKAADAAAAAAKNLSDQLKGIDRAVGDNRRNVGNYVDAVSHLKKEYDDLKAKMDQMIKAGKQDSETFREMSKQLGLLETLTSQAAKGFASVTQELKFNEKALQTLRAAGLENTEAFTQMRQEVAKAREEFREFQEQQKILSSDAPVLTSLTVAAKGLAGAYAVGAGATALFADGNEKVEKELNKLVAVMTLLQGLNEAHELLQKRGAIVVAFRAAAEKLYNFVLYGSTKGLQAKSAAEVVNTEVTEANIVATEAQVAAEEELVVANEAVAASTTAVSGTMAVLRFALIATGIGALLILLPLVATAMGNWFNATKRQEEEQKRLNDALKEYDEALVKANESLSAALEDQKRVLDSEIKVAEIRARSIQDQLNLAEMRKKAAQTEKTNAEIALKDLGLTRYSVDRLELAYDKLQQKIKALQELQIRFANDKDASERNEKTIKAMQDEAAAMEPRLKRGQELVKQIDESSDHLKELNAEDEKFAHELYERKVKALAEINNLLREQQVLDLKVVSGDVNQPEVAKIRALGEEFRLRKEIIESERDLELRSESLTGEERKKIRTKADLDLLHLEQEMSLQVQLVRAHELIQLGLDEQMSRAGILAIQEAFYKKQDELLKSANDRRKAAIEESRDLQLKSLDKSTLPDRLKGIDHGSLKAEEDYQERRKQIEREADIYILKAREDMIKGQIALLKAQGKDTQVLEAEVANIELQITEKTEEGKKEKRIKAASRKKQIQQGEMEVARQLEETGSEFVRAGYEKEINALQEKIDLNNKAKETETANIEQSSLSAQQKAAMLIELDAKTAANNEALQRKQRDEKKKEAQFDRDKALFDIAANTAVSIIKTNAELGLPAALPFDAIATAMGLAQAAAVLAKPIPKYAVGTDYSPAGLAVVGEEGAEMRINPSGEISMTPDRATLTYLERGTKIIPHHEVQDMLLQSIFNNAFSAHDANGQLEAKLDELNHTVRKGNQDLVNALRKQRPPDTHIHLDGDFRAHIENSCR